MALLPACAITRRSDRDYRISMGTDGAVIAGAVLAAAIPYALGTRWVTPRCPCDPAEVNSLDRGAIGNESHAAIITSDLGLGLSLLAPPVLDVLDQGMTSAFVSDLVVYAQALAISGALVSVVKHVVQRPLPRLYAGQSPELLSEPEGYRAFYSGHTALAFSALSVAAMTADMRYGVAPWPWIAVGTLGSIVAVGRVAAGLHFPSDVIVGAALGAWVGVLVPRLHQVQEVGTLVVMPGVDGLRLVWLVRW